MRPHVDYVDRGVSGTGPVEARPEDSGEDAMAELHARLIVGNIDRLRHTNVEKSAPREEHTYDCKETRNRVGHPASLHERPAETVF